MYDFLAKNQNYSISFWLSLPVRSGSLKRIGYPKQICLAHPLSFECCGSLFMNNRTVHKKYDVRHVPSSKGLLIAKRGFWCFNWYLSEFLCSDLVLFFKF